MTEPASIDRLKIGYLERFFAGIDTQRIILLLLDRNRYIPELDPEVLFGRGGGFNRHR
ncbi:MAG: hypothetical protein RR853_09130 [Aurantimicrobium sp.]